MTIEEREHYKLNMGFISGDKQNTIVDSEFGKFDSINSGQNFVTWMQNINIYDSDIELFIEGTKDALNKHSKKLFVNIINEQEFYFNKCSSALLEEYSNGKKTFVKWQDAFKLVAISIHNDEIEFSFEEKEIFYHFNVHFDLKNETWVSVDS